METLNPVEARVLGALVEKDLTTPDYYPLSLNALTNACMTGGAGGVISPPGATPHAVVVATREEWMIACDTAKLARHTADVLVEAS